MYRHNILTTLHCILKEKAKNKLTTKYYYMPVILMYFFLSLSSVCSYVVLKRTVLPETELSWNFSTTATVLLLLLLYCYTYYIINEISNKLFPMIMIQKQIVMLLINGKMCYWLEYNISTELLEHIWLNITGVSFMYYLSLLGKYNTVHTDFNIQSGFLLSDL